MKITSDAIVLFTLFIASNALATGNHAGGHHHDSGAIGQAGIAANVSRTVTISMSDTMRFVPDNVTVQEGETIRFVVKNDGKIKHEMVLGTTKDLQVHAALMKKHPEMEHADANMASVQPGSTGEIIWQFSKAGKVSFACLQPGHFDAGMKGNIVVSGEAIPPNEAATAAMDTKEKALPSPSPSTSSAGMSDGEIRKVDKEARKITIKHGEIKGLDMPPMTMVFQIKDAAMLDQVKVGDKVKFVAEKLGGVLVVTKIEMTSMRQ